MKKTISIFAVIIAVIALVYLGFMTGVRYAAKSVQEYSLSYDAGVKIALLRSLKEKKEANAILFLERELAGQLARLQNLEKQTFLSPSTSQFSKDTRTKGAIYFTVFPRKEDASKVFDSAIKDLASEPITAQLSTDSYLLSLKEMMKNEDALFTEMMDAFKPASFSFAEQQLYKRLKKTAEQGAAANP